MADELTPQTQPADEQPANPEAYDLENGPLKASVDQLMERLGLKTGDDPSPGAPTEESPANAGEGKPTPEKDDGVEVDWDKFELDPALEHLYRKSQPMTLPDGTTGFVVVWVEFKTISRPVATAGEYISQMVNGAEQWQLSALLPNGAGLITVILQRSVRRLLPHPTLLQTETKVTAPADPELQQTEDAALSWAGQETPERRAVLDAIAAEAEQQAEQFGAVEGADAE